jgi:hypothetical protein
LDGVDVNAQRPGLPDQICGAISDSTVSDQVVTGLTFVDTPIEK